MELGIKFNFNGDDEIGIPTAVVQEVIRAAHANSELKVLDLSSDSEELLWDSHLSTISRITKGSAC